MPTLKYTVIKTKKQYSEYCRILEALIFSGSKRAGIADEIDLLTLLIKTWNDARTGFKDTDPVMLLRSLMTDQQLKAKDLSELLEISKGYVSDILNYRKGFSKAVIRKLAEHFKLSQEAFNRAYSLKADHKTTETAVAIRKKSLPAA